MPCSLVTSRKHHCHCIGRKRGGKEIAAALFASYPLLSEADRRQIGTMLISPPQLQQWKNDLLAIIGGDKNGKHALLDALKWHSAFVHIQQVLETIRDTDNLKLDCYRLLSSWHRVSARLGLNQISHQSRQDWRVGCRIRVPSGLNFPIVEAIQSSLLKTFSIWCLRQAGLSSTLSGE